VDVQIPRNSLTVVTGLSGSGKSSLAFDTLYAEGQRRYVESLSAYARQFLDQMQKPDVERIEGLSPAIAIEQRTSGGNPRSIVATVTEIHDYLRLLWGSVGEAHCPQCGKPVRRQSAEQIVETLMKLPSGEKFIIYAPVVKGRKGRHEDAIAALKRAGFVRLRIDGATYPVEEAPSLDKKKIHSIDVVVDRLVMPKDESSGGGAGGPKPAEAASASQFVTRLTDSVELGLKTGDGVITVERVGSGETTYSEKNACPDCGLSFDELKPRSFSFNSPFGACPTCGGLGSIYYFDEDLVVPDKSLPLRECIHPWRRAGHMAIMYYNEILSRIAKQYKVKLDTPYEKLPADFRRKLMHGFDDDLILPWRREDKPFAGVLDSVKRMMENAESEERREKFEAYQSERACPACHGTRLRPESRVATVAGKTIVEAMAMTVKDSRKFFEGLLEEANGVEASGASRRESSRNLAPMKDVLKEIVKRLGFLDDVGLDYLTLDRSSGSLSGGEMQRIRLATQIGSGLTGVLYVLDEPTIGLHPRDNERLIAMLKQLRDRGNTVVVVEHDAEMMRTADWIVDLGPGAGRQGGRVMYQGDYKGLLKAKSLTADYLTGRRKVVPSANLVPSAECLVPSANLVPGAECLVPSANLVPSAECLVPSAGRRKGNALGTRHQALGTNGRALGTRHYLAISGCCEHNLKNITARFPVGAFTVVTGVSGSGKSTLVDETLKRELMRRFYHSKAKPGKFRRLSGFELIDKVIEIDQSPIGRTPRSNPATYVGFFSDIRELFSRTESAKARGYTAGRFSFNVKGGRCEVCGGDGVRKLEMSFLPDVYVTCEQCGGRRFNRETLEVKYGGKTIADVLDMTVAEACVFFSKVPRLAAKLKTLEDVGLGYLGLGQSATTLSGGEAQRIKLATELSRRSTGRTLYLLDEPTTGLHFDDVAKLLRLLLKLRDAGNTVVVIEHNVDVMKAADWIVDLGPGGGDAGGRLVCEGPPETVRQCKESLTGRFL
jgi:excinuclease ABC subunit A